MNVQNNEPERRHFLIILIEIIHYAFSKQGVEQALDTSSEPIRGSRSDWLTGLLEAVNVAQSGCCPEWACPAGHGLCSRLGGWYQGV